MAAALGPDAPWVRFSQSEDLTVRLRNILHDYAFGPGVFRELLQNADDARARRLVLLADGSEYGKTGSGLLDERLGAWQGPAVCAFNDAEFSDADFDGICRVGASGKRSDHTKIGHYGLGFNATYHLTDVVSFVSRDRLCIFDPHEAHLPSNLPGLQLRLGPGELTRYEAQLAPFEAAARACVPSPRGGSPFPLKGALFRLALRTPQLAARSQICQEFHTLAEVIVVLRELLSSAHELLLFLQSVEEVEVLSIGGLGEAPLRLGRASLRTACEASGERLRRERRLMAEAAAAATEVRGARRAAYAFAIEVVEDEARTTLTAWLVVARAEPVGAAEAAGASEPGASELPRHRCAAVAMRLWPPATEVPLAGSAFCFLPLSLSTGLAAHVSCNFALSANRRDLWRRSDDKAASHGNRRAAWNEELLLGAAPRAYADALELCAAGLGRGGQAELALKEKDVQVTGFQAWNLLPDGPWGAALLAGDRPAAEVWAHWPAGGQGLFEPLPERTASELFSRNAKVLWDTEGHEYRTPKAALLCPAEEYAQLGLALRSALAQLKVLGTRRSVVEVPTRVAGTLEDVKGAVWLQPQPLALAMRSAAPVLTAEQADALVAYLLGPAGAGPLTVLLGLQICPLAGGGLGLFEKPETPGVPELWWAEDPEFQHLVPKRQFVDPSSTTFRLLKPRAASSALNLRPLNARSLPELLPAVLPPEWRGRREVRVVDGRVEVDGEDAEVLHAASTGSASCTAPSKVPASRGGQRVAGKANGSAVSSKGPSKAGRQAAKAATRRPQARWDDGRDDYEEDGSWSGAGWGEAGGDWSADGWPGEGEGGWEEDWGAAGGGRGRGGATLRVMQEDREAEQACRCCNEADLAALVRRCELLWRLVEGCQEKGVNPLQLLSDFPCIPVATPLKDHDGWPRLISVHEAVKRHALAVTDFTQQDRLLLEGCGVRFITAGKRLRAALDIDKSTLLSAIHTALAERWTAAEASPDGQDKDGRKARLYKGLRQLQLPWEEALPLRNLLQSKLRKGQIPRDAKLLEVLPIFETLGGRVAVPLLPVSARVLPPTEDWDEALRPLFADYLLRWDGEAGEWLKDIGRERGNTASFLAEFIAPRLGLLDQGICVKFLEILATFGSAPWKVSGAPRDLVAAAQACANAPLVVFPASGGTPEVRRRCNELSDPGDAKVPALPGREMHLPPPEYCTPVTLSVMRRAGMRSLLDEAAFLEAARLAEASANPVERGAQLLRQLAEKAESLKWSARAFAALARLRIFPALAPDTMAGAYPPMVASGTAVAAPLDGSATLFEHAPVVWTVRSLLDPRALEAWPPSLLRRFASLQGAPTEETVSHNLRNACALWSAESPAVAAEKTATRQAIVEKHLAALRTLGRRNHATQSMVRHSLAQTAFIALDDGSLVKPCDVFEKLHAGGDSSSEGEGAEEECTDKRRGRTRKSAPWRLPMYLRPYRRVLLTLAGPLVSTARKVPSIHVGPAPDDSRVPDFIRAALDQPELADVEFIVCCETDRRSHTVYAHRLVLAAACDHFHSSFTSFCREAVGVNGRCRIEMPDWVSHTSLLWLLAYLYQGYDAEKAYNVALRLEVASNGRDGERVSGPPLAVASKSGGSSGVGGRRRPAPRFAQADSGEELCCLLRLSDMYGLEHLLRWCEHRLQALVTAENVVALSTHAFFCNASQLLRFCVYHMQLLYADIAPTGEWEDLEPAIKDMVLVEWGEENLRRGAGGGAAPLTTSS